MERTILGGPKCPSCTWASSLATSPGGGRARGARTVSARLLRHVTAAGLVDVPRARPAPPVPLTWEWQLPSQRTWVWRPQGPHTSLAHVQVLPPERHLPHQPRTPQTPHRTGLGTPETRHGPQPPEAQAPASSSQLVPTPRPNVVRNRTRGFRPTPRPPGPGLPSAGAGAGTGQSGPSAPPRLQTARSWGPAGGAPSCQAPAGRRGGPRGTAPSCTREARLAAAVFIPWLRHEPPAQQGLDLEAAAPPARRPVRTGRAREVVRRAPPRARAARLCA